LPIAYRAYLDNSLANTNCTGALSPPTATQRLTPTFGAPGAASAAVALYGLHNVFYAIFSYVGGLLGGTILVRYVSNRATQGAYCSMKIVISSGHGKHVSGAVGIINEVTEARKVVSRVAEYMRKSGAEVVEFHEDNAKSQAHNVNNIIAFHNKQTRDYDLSVHFNAHSKTDDPRGAEVLYVTAGTLAAKVSKSIADASGLKNRGAKCRTDLGFLNKNE
jgi:N-acetylmuramoyl-L-alanine amidase